MPWQHHGCASRGQDHARCTRPMHVSMWVSLDSHSTPQQIAAKKWRNKNPQNIHWMFTTKHVRNASDTQKGTTAFHKYQPTLHAQSVIMCVQLQLGTVNLLSAVPQHHQESCVGGVRAPAFTWGGMPIYRTQSKMRDAKPASSCLDIISENHATKTEHCWFFQAPPLICQAFRIISLSLQKGQTDDALSKPEK